MHRYIFNCFPIEQSSNCAPSSQCLILICMGCKISTCSSNANINLYIYIERWGNVGGVVRSCLCVRLVVYMCECVDMCVCACIHIYYLYNYRHIIISMIMCRFVYVQKQKVMYAYGRIETLQCVRVRAPSTLQIMVSVSYSCCSNSLPFLSVSICSRMHSIVLYRFRTCWK